MLSISERYEFNIIKARLTYIEQLFQIEDVAEEIKQAVLTGGVPPKPAPITKDRAAEEAPLSFVITPPPQDARKDMVETLNRSELMRLLKTLGVSYPITATRDDLLALYRAHEAQKAA